jgi:signal transduction histidine kinase
LAETHTEGQEHGDRAAPSSQGAKASAEVVLREIQQSVQRERRLAAVRRTALLDTPAEESFDRLARLATRVTDSPVGLVTLVDRDRQFFKSCVGLPPPWCDVRQTPLTHSFCMHVVATGQPLLIEDARLHPMLSENLAVDQLGVVAYAGVPLFASEGEAIGTFCVIDTEPRIWTSNELNILEELATSVMTEIELRAMRSHGERAQLAEAALAEAESARERFALLSELSAVLAEGFDIRGALNRAVKLVIPLVADGCLVELLEEDGQLRRVALIHVDEHEEAWLRSQPQPRVLLSPESKDASQVMGFIRLSGPEGSAIRLPLTSRGRVLGITTFTTAPSRQVGEVELALARDVARRMALAVENARLHQESRAAIQTRDTFLSVASHELRTPLTVLRLQVQSLLRGARSQASALSSEEVEGKARVIARQVERLGQLVDELLDISRLTEGRLSFQLEDVDLTEVVREVSTRFREEFVRAGSALSFQGLDSPVVGRWNRLRVEQVVINLLTNAIKYGRRRPILVTVTADADHAWLSVRDEGIGISPRDQARIFERFERAVSDQHYGGLGLGLWIVREIVRGFGGSISVKSAPEVGSTFTVELPREPVQAPAPLLH